jgi:dihydrolipoamide dehydrogenase
MKQYDVLIIGGGIGGTHAAFFARKKGLSVALVEKDGEKGLGGTCLNRGCIPTKSLLSNTDYEKSFGSIAKLKDGLSRLVRASAIDFFDTADGIEAKNIIIATGSKPKRIGNFLTSDEVLKELPKGGNIAVLGGGVIGVEFAEIFQKFGKKVTIYEAADRILSNFDPDISRFLTNAFTKNGIKIVTNFQGEEIIADEIVSCVGRNPNMDEKWLQNRGVEYCEKGIFVDEFCRTNVKNIYAVGDVSNSGRPMLAHAAAYEAEIAISHILGQKREESVIPFCVYSTPEIAACGKLTEPNFVFAKSFYGANGRAVASGKESGFVKVVLDENGALVGTHIAGEAASEMIGFIAILINQKIKAEKIAASVFPHPTYSEVFFESLRTALDKRLQL